MRATLSVLAFCVAASAASAQDPGGRTSPAADAPTIWVGAGLSDQERVEGLLRAELEDLPHRIRPWSSGSAEEPGVLFGLEELDLRRLAGGGHLASLEELDEPMQGFRDPGGLYALTLLSPFALAYDARVWSPESAPGSWDELPFATEGRDVVGVVAPEVDPTPWASWIVMQLEQGATEARAFAWLAALDARVPAYSASYGELVSALDGGRVSLAVLPLAQTRDTGAPGSASLRHRLPSEGLPCSAFGVALLRGSDPAARAIAARLLTGAFSKRCAMELDLLSAPRSQQDLEARPIDERALLGQLIRLPEPAVVDRWIARFQAGVRGRGREFEQLDTVLDLVFAVLFAGFLVFVYTRIRRSDARDQAS